MLPKGGEVSLLGTQTPRAAALYRIQSTAPESPAPLPDMKGWLHFAQQAETSGIESLLVSFSRYEPDTFMVSCALGRATKTLKFIAAYRSGLMQPATFVQQVNTLSALIEGRIAINIVAGSSKTEQHSYGDYLEHDERYERAEEFLAVCNCFWRGEGEVNFTGKHYRVEQGRLHTPFLAPDRISPEVYVSGHSAPAEALAGSQGTCLLRVAGDPDKLQPAVARVREQGIEVCLRVCLLCRETRDEAISVAESLLPEREIPQEKRSVALKDDSQMYREAATVADSWLTRSLWTGLVPYYGPVWTTLVGTPREIADALLDYRRIGVTQFIMSGWPELDTVVTFGRDVLPLVRAGEEQRKSQRA